METIDRGQPRHDCFLSEEPPSKYEMGGGVILDYKFKILYILCRVAFACRHENEATWLEKELLSR